MFAYIIRRILATIPVMAVVAVFVFALLYLSPGDPAAIIAGDTATVDDIARIRAHLGLDRPVYIQFGSWVWRLLHGDLGISIFTNLPVAKLIEQRLEPTAALSLATLIVSVLVGHALKNAAVPIVTVIGIGVALLIGGVVVTETVFAIPGLGRLTVDAILRRDYPIIQGIILIFSGAYVLVNLLVDLSYTLLDPRIRY